MPSAGNPIRGVMVVALVTLATAFFFLKSAYDRGRRSEGAASVARIASLEAQLAGAVKKDGERPRNLVLPEWKREDFFNFAHGVESIDPLSERGDGFLYFTVTVSGAGRTDRFVGKIRAGEMERMAFGILKCQLDSAKSVRSGK